MKYATRILAALVIFSVGVLGGVWAHAFLLPYLAAQGFSEDWKFVKAWSERTVVLETVERIVIDEREGIERAARDASQFVVGIESTAAGAQTITGSGFVYTEEGLIVTVVEAVPQGYSVRVTLGDQDFQQAQVLRRDASSGLALLQVNRNGLRTTSFVSEGNIRQGLSVFLFGKPVVGGTVSSALNEGVIRSMPADGVFSTTMFEASIMRGSPIFDVRGRLVGIATMDANGRVQAIGPSVLRVFLEERN